MSQSVSVSIIVPVYNAGKYVERCIRSIIAQTYTGTMECIIVDDRGSDDSMKRVNRLLDNYDGPIDFKIITHPENKGLSEARNSGIHKAQGEYIFFIDSDDELSIYAMEAFMKKANENPDAEIIIGEYYFFNTPRIPNPNKKLNKKRDCKTATLTNKYGFSHNRLIKRSFILNNNLLFYPKILMEDNLWSWHLAKCISSIDFVRTGTYVYYINPGSIMHSFNIKRIDDSIKICKIKVTSIDPICKKWQLRNCITHILDTDSDIRYVYTGKDYNDRLDMVKEIVKKMNMESIKAFDIRSILSLFLLNIELRLPISVNNRLYWLLHRAAKMFAVYPRPKF